MIVLFLFLIKFCPLPGAETRSQPDPLYPAWSLLSFASTDPGGPEASSPCIIIVTIIIVAVTIINGVYYHHHHHILLILLLTIMFSAGLVLLPPHIVGARSFPQGWQARAAAFARCPLLIFKFIDCVFDCYNGARFSFLNLLIVFWLLKLCPYLIFKFNDVFLIVKKGCPCLIFKFDHCAFDGYNTSHVWFLNSMIVFLIVKTVPLFDF